VTTPVLRSVGRVLLSILLVNMVVGGAIIFTLLPGGTALLATALMVGAALFPLWVLGD
jgi:hypothetical protein